MSDTPRTDAEEWPKYLTKEERGFVWGSFARELERENNQLREVIRQNLATIKTLSEQVGAAAELRAGLEKIVQGGYAVGSDVAHPAIRVARDTLDPKWRERAASHYPHTPTIDAARSAKP